MPRVARHGADARLGPPESLAGTGLLPVHLQARIRPRRPRRAALPRATPHRRHAGSGKRRARHARAVPGDGARQLAS